MSRPAKVIIDLSALQHNLHIAQQCQSGRNIVAVLKANAYGHGAIEVAQSLQAHVSKFAVSSIEEAIQLREAGIEKSILLLEGCFNSSELHLCQQQHFEIVVHNTKQIDDLIAAELSAPLAVWVKVDTGMHRLGLSVDDAREQILRLHLHSNIAQPIVLMTHMASADLLEEEYTSAQYAQFIKLKQDVLDHMGDVLTSIENSGTMLGWPNIVSDMCRPGIMLYGLSPFSQPHNVSDQLRPVMSLVSEVIAIRTIEAGEKVGYGSTWTAHRRTRIATVAIGYGDGYPRNAKNGTPVLVNGERAELAGRVSMDMLTVDITDLGEVAIGDSVELWGQNLNANEVASYADTIGYELVTRMPIRVPKHYLP